MIHDAEAETETCDKTHGLLSPGAHLFETDSREWLRSGRVYLSPILAPCAVTIVE